MNDRFEISHDPETRYFSLDDKKNQEIIIIRDEQLEALIKEYCLIFGYMII
jgi:hypothetical protein